MFSICHQPEAEGLYSAFTYYQFDRVVSNTQREATLIKHTPGNTYEKLENWRRTKLISQDYRAIVEYLHLRNLNFVDPQFPHESASVGWRFDKKIEWARVQEVVTEAIYYSSEGVEYLSRFHCSNRALEIAICAIARTRPELLKNHLTKVLEPDGIYQFCFMRHDRIVSVIIDDYIPVISGKPLFCNAYNFKECFAILLEKALAKLYGSYQSIPTSPAELVEAIACTPVSILQISERHIAKVEQEAFLRHIFEGPLRGWCLLTHNTSDLTEYGLASNQTYQVLNHFTLMMESRQVRLLELEPTNDTQLGSWNGPFSEHDVNTWGRVSTSEKQVIFQSLSRARSFLVDVSQLPEYFVGGFAIESMPNNSIDWLQLLTDSHHASYAQFYLSKPWEIFLRVYSEMARHVLILAQVNGGQYHYSGGVMQESSERTTVRANLKAGRYIAFIKCERESDQRKFLTLFVSCREQILLSKTSKQQHPQLLSNMFTRMAHQLPEQMRLALPSVQYITKVMYWQTGYAFLWVRVQPQNRHNNGIIVQFDEKALRQKGFKVRKPYANSGFMKIMPGEQILLTMKICNRNETGPVVFPSLEFRFVEQQHV